MSYGVSLGGQLYLNGEGEKISSSGFNLGYMVTVNFYKLCEFLGCCSAKWEGTTT